MLTVINVYVTNTRFIRFPCDEQLIHCTQLIYFRFDCVRFVLFFLLFCLIANHKIAYHKFQFCSKIIKHPTCNVRCTHASILRGIAWQIVYNDNAPNNECNCKFFDFVDTRRTILEYSLIY